MVPVPGSQELGLAVGTKCAFCLNLAVSKCNHKDCKFIGCDRAFCRDCGLPHFSSGMVNSEKIGSYLQDASIDEDTKNLIKKASIDRSSNTVPF